MLTLGSLHLKHHLCSYVMAHLTPRVSRYPDWLSLDEMGKSLAAPTELWCFFLLFSTKCGFHRRPFSNKGDICSRSVEEAIC